VRCCPVMKQWNCYCCSYELGTAAVIVGRIYMVLYVTPFCFSFLRMLFGVIGEPQYLVFAMS